jgi:hypothetical protein
MLIFPLEILVARFKLAVSEEFKIVFCASTQIATLLLSSDAILVESD